MSTGTPDNRPSTRSMVSSETPSSYAALDPAVRERIDRITPIGRDRYGTFLFKPEDQAFVDTLISRGATIDRNGRVTNVPDGVRLDPFLDDDHQDTPKLICGYMKPRSFGLCAVAVSSVLVLAAIGGVVAAVLSQKGNDPPSPPRVERFVNPTESLPPSMSSPLPSLQPSVVVATETTNDPTGAPTDSPDEPPSSSPSILTPSPTSPPTAPPTPFPSHSSPTSLPMQPAFTGLSSQSPVEIQTFGPSVTPTNDTNCTTVCADGSPVPFPNRIISEDDTGWNITCGEVDLAFDDFIHIGCLSLQSRGAAYCGCPGPPPEDSFCWICHDDMPLSPEKSDIVAFILDDGSNLTCGDIASVGASSQEIADKWCFDSQVWGSLLCGCNSPLSEAKCWICPDGSVPSVMSHRDSEQWEACVEAAEIIAKIDDEDLCQIQVDIWAPICGCSDETLVVPSTSPSTLATDSPFQALTSVPSFSPANDTNCTSLCKDGSSVLFPDRVIGTSTQTGRNLTCGEVDLGFDDFVENGCTFLQTRGAAYCGCPGPPPDNICWICHDNMPLKVESLDTAVFYSTNDNSPITCGDVATVIASNDELCFDGQVKGSLACGCASPHPAAKCWICPDGSVPSSFSSTDRGQREACRVAAETIATIDDEEDCKAQVEIWAPFCGCANNTESSTPAPTLSLSLSTPTTAPVSVIGRNDTNCSAVCSDGSNVPFPENTATVGPSGRNITCGEIEQEFESYRNEYDCLVLQTWGVISCGCPGPPPEDTLCWICHDWSVDPVQDNVDTTVFIRESDGVGITCGDIAFDLATDETNEDGLCVFAQTLASLFCGCPSPLPESSCWICPDGGWPTVPVDSVDRDACIEAADYISGLDDVALCEREVEFWGPTCGCTTSVPSEAPPPPPASSNLPESSPTTANVTMHACAALCSDGALTPLPKNTAVPASSADDPTTTCGALEANLEDFVRQLSEETDQDAESACFYFQVIGSLRCGCLSPHPLAKCWFECPEGERLAPDKLDDVIGFDTSGTPFTCTDIALNAAVSSKEQGENEEEVVVCASIQEVWTGPCCEAFE